MSPGRTHSGAPLSAEQLQQLHDTVLKETAATGRAHCAGFEVVEDADVPGPPPDAPDALSPRSVLQRRLDAVRALKARYARLYDATLSHLPLLAASLQQKQAAGQEAGGGARRADRLLESDEEMAGDPPGDPAAAARGSFSDAEHQALTAASAGADSAGTGAAQPSPLPQATADFVPRIGSVAAMEQLAAAAAAFDMDSWKALAVLCGRRHRFLVHSTVVLIGRDSKSQGQVDVDISVEQSAAGVSRHQCLLELQPPFGFLLTNSGRQMVLVNNSPVAPGQQAPVPHLSLIEIACARLFLVVNTAAVQRAALDAPACPKALY